MAKATSFQAKIAKGSSQRSAKMCPKCGEALQAVKFVTSERSEVKSSWKFNQRFIEVCKCNEQEVYS